MRSRLLRVVAITAFGMLVGCKSHDQLVIDTICPTSCRCAEPDFPQFCEEDCRENLDPAEVSQACFDCFLAEKDSACFLIEQRCEPRCAASMPIDAPEPIFVDAPAFPPPF